ncbi:ASCH domain-containing protein [Bacillus sp. 03113]|uniref:ASCH domain-containing protein n=1 Tax=Bacillus sp. 03113 TaxID=2578211 RepID=UPI0011444D32|nr:ASCH domain-containing protein [Bacillus sp. 03113]
MKVLLSIKPEYVQEIINGKKKFEYRKRIFKEQVESVIVYSTMPVGKIIGEFTIDTILFDSPIELWNKTYKYSGISKDSFLDYFSGREEGFAIKIKNFFEYDKPINPKDMDKNFIAPQSYKYIRKNTEQLKLEL